MKPLKRKMDLNTAVGGLRHAMSLIAIWPNMPETLTITVIWFGHFAGFFTAISASLIGAIVIDRDFEKLIAVLGQTIPITVITAKYGLFKGQLKNVKYFLKTMEEDWDRQTQRSTEDKAALRYLGIMIAHARISRLFFYMYITIVSICWVLFVIAPITRKISATNQSINSNELPMNTWYPLPNYLQSPTYEILYAFEIATGTGMVIAHTSIDGLLVVSIFHLCGQFEILRCYIEEFGTKGRNVETMRADVRFIVQQHVSIINAARAVEESFNQILLGQLLGGTVSICLAGFSFLQAMETNNVTALVRFGFLLTMSLQQMFIYSFAGDYLTSQSAVIRMAAHNAYWYELPPSVSKSFSFIMMRASEPITITAGKFFTMSLTGFTKILKSSASYLSVMRAINTDKSN